MTKPAHSEEKLLSDLARVKEQFQLQALIAALGLGGELKLVDGNQADGVE